MRDSKFANSHLTLVERLLWTQLCTQPNIASKKPIIASKRVLSKSFYRQKRLGDRSICNDNVIMIAHVFLKREGL